MTEAIIGAAVALAGTAYTAANDQDQNRKQKNALGRQRFSERQAEIRASNESQAVAEDVAKARRSVPNLGELLSHQEQESLAGPGSTLLTADPRLNRKSLLGG